MCMDMQDHDVKSLEKGLPNNLSPGKGDGVSAQSISFLSVFSFSNGK
jgi:hypothetical protein